MANPTDERLYKLLKPSKWAYPSMEIYRLSGVDPFFLYKIQNIVDMEAQLRSLNLAEDISCQKPFVKQNALGFSDEQIARMPKNR